MTRPNAQPVRRRVADLFSGDGGAGEGYRRAGFDVVGVDLVRRGDYPCGEFVEGDALTFDLEGFDLVHASPPCQRYMRGGLATGDHPDLLPAVRERLEEWGGPYVIENVPGAPMRADLLLCGSMFGLAVRRHRWFETNLTLPIWTPTCDHSKKVAGVYGHLHGAKGAAPGMLPGTLETWREAMGIDWMDAPALALAIPPAYTEFIGQLVLEQLEVAA